MGMLRGTAAAEKGWHTYPLERPLAMEICARWHRVDSC
jgi:hypothetical protein